MIGNLLHKLYSHYFLKNDEKNEKCSDDFEPTLIINAANPDNILHKHLIISMKDYQTLTDKGFSVPSKESLDWCEIKVINDEAVECYIKDEMK